MENWNIMDINRAWGRIRQKLQISSVESLVYQLKHIKHCLLKLLKR